MMKNIPELHIASQTLNVFGDMESKAAFVGAKSVMGPGCERSSTSPAALTRETRVENSGWNTSRSRTEHRGVQAPRGAWLAREGGWRSEGWAWW